MSWIFGLLGFLMALVLAGYKHTCLKLSHTHNHKSLTHCLHNCRHNSAGNGVVLYLMCMDLRSLCESGLQFFFFDFMQMTKPELSSQMRCCCCGSFTFLQSDFFFSFVLKTTTANRRLIWKALVFSFSLCSLLPFFSFFNQSFEAHTPCSL